MHRDGLGADEELAADLAVAAALGDEGEDLGLARGEAGARADDRDPRGRRRPSLREQRRGAELAGGGGRRLDQCPGAVGVAGGGRAPRPDGSARRRARRARRTPRTGPPPRARRRAARPGREGRRRRPTASAGARRTAAPPRRGSRGPTRRGRRRGGRARSGRRRRGRRRSRRPRPARPRCGGSAAEAKAASTVVASRTRAWKSGCQMPVSVSTIRRYVASAAAWSPACSCSASSADPPVIAISPSCRQNAWSPRASASAPGSPRAARIWARVAVSRAA